MGLISRVSSRTYRNLTPGTDKNMSRSRSRSPVASERVRTESGSARRRSEHKDPRGQWKKNTEPSRTVGVFGLDWETSERELERKMKKYGKIEKCYLVMNRVEMRSKGFGFVSYDKIEDAIQAVKDMNGRTIERRTVRVDFSYTKEDELKPKEQVAVPDRRRESASPEPRHRRRSHRSRSKTRSRSPSPRIYGR